MDGIISVIKPAGISSHDVVNWARRVYRIRKVGHAGTLDPGAVGVLVLAMGKGTRLIPYLQKQKKQYRAEISLGFTTESLDLFSPVTEQRAVPEMTESAWQKILQSFIGKLEQVPPMTSALKVNGQALYKLAREGITVERESREITIYDCSLVRYNPQNKKLIIDISCSAGTYIRTLGNQIAERAGTCGCMSFLIRTAVGSFTLQNSSLMSERQEIPAPLISAVANWQKIYCDHSLLKDIKNGKIIEVTDPITNQEIALIGENNSLLALAKKISDRKCHPFKVFI